MLQCNEHVEMNKFLCSLACTCMTILDSQFYIFEIFQNNETLAWWLPGCSHSNQRCDVSSLSSQFKVNFRMLQLNFLLSEKHVEFI